MLCLPMVHALLALRCYDGSTMCGLGVGGAPVSTDTACCAFYTAYCARPWITCVALVLCLILHAALNPACCACRAMKRSGEITFNGGQLTKRHKRQIGFVMQVW